MHKRKRERAQAVVTAAARHSLIHQAVVTASPLKEYVLTHVQPNSLECSLRRVCICCIHLVANGTILLAFSSLPQSSPSVPQAFSSPQSPPSLPQAFSSPLSLSSWLLSSLHAPLYACEQGWSRQVDAVVTATRSPVRKAVVTACAYVYACMRACTSARSLLTSPMPFAIFWATCISGCQKRALPAYTKKQLIYRYKYVYM